jgi:hypothetical protein
MRCFPIQSIQRIRNLLMPKAGNLGAHLAPRFQLPSSRLLPFLFRQHKSQPISFKQFTHSLPPTILCFLLIWEEEKGAKMPRLVVNLFLSPKEKSSYLGSPKSNGLAKNGENNGERSGWQWKKSSTVQAHQNHPADAIRTVLLTKLRPTQVLRCSFGVGMALLLASLFFHNSPTTNNILPYSIGFFLFSSHYQRRRSVPAMVLFVSNPVPTSLTRRS